MKKVFTLIAACIVSAVSAFAQQHGAMNFVGQADFYVTLMKDNTFTKVSKDTVKVTLGSDSKASITTPAMVYKAMGVTVNPFTLSDLAYTMTGSPATGNMVFTWNASNLTTTTPDATGNEKTVTVSSLTATYTHATGKMTLAMEFKYGSMPFALTYENEGYYTMDNAWHLVGRGTEGNPYKIYDASDFAAMANNISADNTGEGEYFTMMNNINFGGTANSPVQLPAIGKSAITNITSIAYGFQGTFDAQNDTITGVYHTACDNDASGKFNGLFSSVGNKGVIKNLVIGKDNYIKSYNYVAPIVSVLAGTVDHCTNLADIEATNFAASGIVGCMAGGQEQATVKDCKNYGTIYAMTYAAGIVGGTVSTTATAPYNYLITNCENYGNMSTINGTGSAGIAGSYCGTITKCTNNGNIDDTQSTNKSRQYNGGIVATCSRVCVIDSCTNNGTVKGVKNVGGIVGQIMGEQYNSQKATITHCVNNGVVSALESGVSGIAANVVAKWGQDQVVVSYCQNNAEVTTAQEDKSTIGNMRGNSLIALGEGNDIKGGLTRYTLDGNTPSGINDIEANATASTAKAVKTLKNGRIVIMKGDKTYSVSGIEL